MTVETDTPAKRPGIQLRGAKLEAALDEASDCRSDGDAGLMAWAAVEIGLLRGALRRIAYDRPQYPKELEVFRLARVRHIARVALK